VIGHFDNSDINKVKEILGSHICIMGNVPPSLLQIGTQEEVKNYCRTLIDEIGRKGGFILASRSAVDEAKPENVKAMIDFTKEYGVYR
jgi:uroporphyrinogen-III decarboxylase